MYRSGRQKQQVRQQGALLFFVITETILFGRVQKTLYIKAEPLNFGSKAPSDGNERLFCFVSLRRLC